MPIRDGIFNAQILFTRCCGCCRFITKFKTILVVVNRCKICALLNPAPVQGFADQPGLELRGQCELGRLFLDKSLIKIDTNTYLTQFLEDAERWARARDLQSESERGPLHGLPISVKECYFIKNYDSTAGLTFNAEKPCPRV